MISSKENSLETIVKCSECLHWTPREANEFGSCDGIADGSTWFDRSEMAPSQLAFTSDDEGFFSCILTKAEFFCAHYEPRYR
jgi:hypothetical protein